MNIVLIIVDTLRYDYVGAHGNSWIKTPHMDRLAAESWVFDNSWCASFPTIPHRTDVMTGAYGDPFHAWMPLRHDRVTVPRVLAEGGYCTQLIHDTPHLVNGGHNFDWPFHAWTPVRGAEVDRPWIDDSREWLENWQADPLFEFADRDCLWKNRTAITYMRANRRRTRDEDWNCARLFDTAAAFLRDNTSRDSFFLWVDSFDPHEPWDAPREMMKRYVTDPGYDGHIDPRAFVVMNAKEMTEAARQRVAAQYAAKVSWVDTCLGKFLETLERTGLAKRTAIILTADHGTKINDYGRFSKGRPVREQEGHTPMIVRVPGGGSGRCDAFVQPQDLFATIAGIAGVPAPERLDSRNILAIAQGKTPAARAFALAGGSADPRWAEPGAIICTLFDREWQLEAAASPERSRLRRYGSENEVSNEHPKVVEGLHAKAVDELERRGADPKLMRWLRARGETEFPQDCVFHHGYPAPEGYRNYFERLYLGG